MNASPCDTLDEWKEAESDEERRNLTEAFARALFIDFGLEPDDYDYGWSDAPGGDPGACGVFNFDDNTITFNEYLAEEGYILGESYPMACAGEEVMHAAQADFYIDLTGNYPDLDLNREHMEEGARAIKDAILDTLNSCALRQTESPGETIDNKIVPVPASPMGDFPEPAENPGSAYA